MHWLAAYWAYLVMLGLYKFVLGGVVGGLISLALAHIVQWLPHVRKARKMQELIADRLDTDTPGGLGELVAHRREREQGHPSAHAEAHEVHIPEVHTRISR